MVNIIDYRANIRESAGKVEGACSLFRYHDDMTSHEFESQDIETAYKKFSGQYDHEVIMNTIGALQVIGYTVISPFIKVAHVKACKDVSEAFWYLEDTIDATIDDEVIVEMCAYTLGHMSYRDDIVTVIRDRRVTSVDEMKQLLSVMRRVSEPLD